MDRSSNPNVNASKKELNSQNPKQEIDGNVSARPQGLELESPEPIDYGEANLTDAQISGYTDEEGNAVSRARENIPGSPTGAYTDLGEGRSSVVHKKQKQGPKH